MRYYINMDQTSERILERMSMRRALPDPEKRTAIREAAGLSLRDLADAIGVSTTTVHFWETGKRKPNAKHLDAYLTVLKTMSDATS